MEIILLETVINAPREVCFNCARDIEAHTASVSHTKEQAVAGRTSGLIKLNESVTWKARHFGIPFTLTSKITAYKFPEYFTDEMTDGPFRYLKHEHIFTEKDGITVMTDKFAFRSPCGILGKVADRLVLKRYMTKFLVKRNKYLKECAEAISFDPTQVE